MGVEASSARSRAPPALFMASVSEVSIMEWRMSRMVLIGAIALDCGELR
jgi:hypothetical protein